MFQETSVRTVSNSERSKIPEQHRQQRRSHIPSHKLRVYPNRIHNRLRPGHPEFAVVHARHDEAGRSAVERCDHRQADAAFIEHFVELPPVVVCTVAARYPPVDCYDRLEILRLELPHGHPVPRQVLLAFRGFAGGNLAFQTAAFPLKHQSRPE